MTLILIDQGQGVWHQGLRERDCPGGRPEGQESWQKLISRSSNQQATLISITAISCPDNDPCKVISLKYSFYRIWIMLFTTFCALRQSALAGGKFRFIDLLSIAARNCGKIQKFADLAGLCLWAASARREPRPDWFPTRNSGASLLRIKAKRASSLFSSSSSQFWSLRLWFCEAFLWSESCFLFTPFAKVARNISAVKMDPKDEVKNDYEDAKDKGAELYVKVSNWSSDWAAIY